MMQNSPISPFAALLLIGCVSILDGCSTASDPEPTSASISTSDSLGANSRTAPDADGWRPLFNGKDLTGWTPKIRTFPLGEDPLNTFRVENGLLTVNYDQYEDQYKDRPGVLFYETPFSSYDLRVEYRFVGEQLSDGPGWAWANSGIMVHGQDPKTMTLDQSAPASIEVQLKGCDQNGEGLMTLRCCTPGTNVERDGQLFTEHCFDSTGPKVPVGQWITVIVEVRGNEVIRHKVGDEVVLEYQKPQLDNRTAEAIKTLKVSEEVFDSLQEGKNKPEDYLLSSGTISLQSESHPIEFRRVEIRELD
jgi:hypothetical protein